MADQLAAIQALEDQRAAERAEAKQLKDAEAKERHGRERRFVNAWSALGAVDRRMDRHTERFPWTEYRDAFCKFRQDLDADGWTDEIATNIDELLSVADAPQMGMIPGNPTMLELVRCVLRDGPDAVTERLTALAKANDTRWTATIGDHGWVTLLRWPDIKVRRERWAAADILVTIDDLEFLSSVPKGTIENKRANDETAPKRKKGGLSRKQSYSLMEKIAWWPSRNFQNALPEFSECVALLQQRKVSSCGSRER